MHSFEKWMQPGVLAACLVFSSVLSGCGRFDPDKTAIIEVSGLVEQADRTEVLEILATMYDNDAAWKQSRSLYNGSLLTVKMSPVRDVEAFSKRINFGTVTEVAGRTVKVRYIKCQDIQSPI